jgi:lysozyme
MKMSDRAIAIVKKLEGYHRELKDDSGRCTAYQETFKDKRTGRTHVDIPTIGWGCTDGVQMGMVWTREEAEAALRRELEKFEAGVLRLTTVPLNQNEFDALCLLTYNIGLGNFKSSTLLKKLNKGDRKGAAKQFLVWNKAGGIVLAGLVSRRSREMALFLEPIENTDDDVMPQTIEKSASPPSGGTIATLSAAATATATTAVGFMQSSATAVISDPASASAKIEAGKGLFLSATSVLALLSTHWPWALAGAGAYVAIFHIVPALTSRGEGDIHA